ncbi:hypothetical protein ACQEU6_03500 [Spirillospora sp. CA-108201]
MYDDMSAAELVELLERLAQTSPHNGGAASALDQATLSFRSKSDQIREAQHAFSAARVAHMDSRKSGARTSPDEAWQELVKAGQLLADALRPLGDMHIARCQAPAGVWPACGAPLNEQGECSNPYFHSESRE